MQMAAFLCYTIAKTDEFVSSRYMEPDELSVQDSLPGARVQRAQLFARVKGGSLAQ